MGVGGTRALAPSIIIIYCFQFATMFLQKDMALFPHGGAPRWSPGDPRERIPADQDPIAFLIPTKIPMSPSSAGYDMTENITENIPLSTLEPSEMLEIDRV